VVCKKSAGTENERSMLDIEGKESLGSDLKMYYDILSFSRHMSFIIVDTVRSKQLNNSHQISVLTYIQEHSRFWLITITTK